LEIELLQMLEVTTTGSRILRRYIDELKDALQTSWEELSNSCHKITSTKRPAVANFTKRLTACVAGTGGHEPNLD